MRLLCVPLVVLFVIGLAMVSAANAETVFAYYAFDSETSGVTPDTVGGNNLTLGTDGSDDAVLTSGGMFGNAATSNEIKDYAQLGDGAADFDATYTMFSISLWANQSGGWADDSFGGRYLAGKYSTGDNRGWALNVKGERGVGDSINQINFDGFQTNDPDDPNISVCTSLDTALTEGYHHIVATFDANGTVSNNDIYAIYIDGIRQTGLLYSSKLDPVPDTLTQINGNNDNNFQVLNRGATATSTTGGGGFIGSIDDCFLATGDVLTDQKVALIHGLGRLAGVSMGDGSTVGGEVGDVLDAYDTLGMATAGGENWYYSTNVGGGTTIGTIGGSVATGDAFIVLGSDGSGVTMVPEPGLLTLLLAIMGSLLFWRKR